MKHNLSFVIFLTSFIFLSCSNDKISSDENLSSLINPDFNLFSRFHDCSINSKKNLNDLEQFIPIFQSNREFINNNELYIYIIDNNSLTVSNFILIEQSRKNKILSSSLKFIEEGSDIFTCNEDTNSYEVTTLFYQNLSDDIFISEVIDCKFNEGFNYGTFSVEFDFFIRSLSNYDLAYKVDFIKNQKTPGRFLWQNYFQTKEEQFNFFQKWIKDSASQEIKQIFEEQVQCFSSSNYKSFKIY